MAASAPPPADASRGGGTAEAGDAGPLLAPPEHVLSTLESDGSRRWLRPRLSQGRWWHRRRWVAYALIAFFVALPHFRIGGKPPILIDILNRQFIFLGHTFFPTDTLLLALLMLGVFVTIVASTAVTGRIWCGWACPQTVYMEYLFRPIDRLFEGTAGKGGKAKQRVTGWRAVARLAVYFVLCAVLAHTFLAYFVGTDNLAEWLFHSPIEHPIAFLVMAATTGLMLFDFLFFREQLCLIACPYGRFQSVMLDRNSLIVAYDRPRGEPRKKGKHVAGDGAGSCVDCFRCVDVCPTGIDIRDGLQMECINCTQCIDACDDVMDRVGEPRGLIRYSSQNAIDGKPQRLLRMRTILYPTLLAIVAVAFLAVLSTKYAFDARLIRNQGNPYYQTQSGQIANRFRLRLTNRTDQARTYQVVAVSPASANVSATREDQMRLEPTESHLVPITVAVDRIAIGGAGQVPVELKVVDDLGNERLLTARLLGPR
ncbi:cytochrome c oxidase accessory protein CcoG [Roseiconus nitratireducens]|uniref:Cytochrome c oxidase accessory protein CcoG n=2 Tax=Roseiconus nitratireducens TaxID=2605748 RepID=A0A5M6DDV8_9BACT|nr:cytochrome c oxidase accessory protein CcoG [Roseiconus nitratireducens]